MVPIPSGPPSSSTNWPTTGQKGTFFCVGDNIRRHPEVFDRIRREGHSWGNHTMRHESGWTTSSFAYLRSHLECDALTASGLFRPPYGRMTKAQARAVARSNRIVMWMSSRVILTGGGPQNECWEATAGPAAGLHCGDARQRQGWTPTGRTVAQAARPPR